MSSCRAWKAIYVTTSSTSRKEATVYGADYMAALADFWKRFRQLNATLLSLT